MGKSNELIEMKTTLANTLQKLQQITLANETLKDDLHTVMNNDNKSEVFEKKYVKAKEIIKELKAAKATRIDEFQSSISRKKERELKYENANAQWKAHADNLEKKIALQLAELGKLRPSKAKSRAFEKLAQEYHRAKCLHEKSKLICRETQTYEVRVHDDKENINQNSNRQRQLLREQGS